MRRLIVLYLFIYVADTWNGQVALGLPI